MASLMKTRCLAGDVLDKAEVVAATCTGAGSVHIWTRTFKLAVLDEASQAIEPATLIPIVCGCEAALLVGDAKQLPPTISSQKASWQGPSMPSLAFLSGPPLYLGGPPISGILSHAYAGNTMHCGKHLSSKGTDRSAKLFEPVSC